jgi:cobaltochelatase CobN
LAIARIFGTKPGDMSGTKILYLVPRSGVWDKEDEIADVYIDTLPSGYRVLNRLEVTRCE